MPPSLESSAWLSDALSEPNALVARNEQNRTFWAKPSEPPAARNNAESPPLPVQSRHERRTTRRRTEETDVNETTEAFPLDCPVRCRPRVRVAHQDWASANRGDRAGKIGRLDHRVLQPRRGRSDRLAARWNADGGLLGRSGGSTG